MRIGQSSVGICSTRTLRCPARFRVAAGGRVTAIAWGSAGLLAITGGDGTVDLWHTTGHPRLARSLQGLRALSGQSETVETVAFSPDGRLVAAGDVTHTGLLTPVTGRQLGTIAIWDVHSGRRVWTWTSTEGTIDALAFSPDGRTLAAAIDDGAVHLFDWHTSRVLWTLDPLGNGQLGFETLAYSPVGLLATGSDAGVVQLWNPRSRTEIGHIIQAADAPVASIVFNPSGQDLVTTEGGSLGVARIWTSNTQQQFGGDFPTNPGQWETARYTPDGSELLIVGADGHGSVWPTTLVRWEMHACGVAARNLTQAEWSQYVTGRNYRKTCARFPAGS